MRLGFQGMGGFISPDEGLNVENGFFFLFVDGTCRYWVKPSGRAPVHAGVLDDAQARALSEQVHYPSWASFDGDFSSPTPPMDSGAVLLWTPTSVASCSGGCEALGTPEVLKEVRRILSEEVLGELHARGQRFEGEAVRVLALHEVDPGGALAWPLAAPVEDFLLDPAEGGPFGRGRLVTGGDAALLRERVAAHRASFVGPPTYDWTPFLGADGVAYGVFLRESLPLEDARGLIRPPAR